MTKVGLKNHPPKICYEKGNGEWAQGKFLVYEAEFNEAEKESRRSRYATSEGSMQAHER